MDKLKVSVYLILVGLLIFGISLLMEIYKKKIRKDKAGRPEIYVISGLLSFSAVIILNLLHVFIPFLNYYFPEAPLWIDYVVWAIVIYILQYQADMKLLKNLIKIAAINLLTPGKSFLSKEEISNLLKNLDSN